MQTRPKVLLVEDDRNITSALSQALQSAYELDIAVAGRPAIYRTDRENYEAIVLDLNLPDISGMAVCQQLRERGCSSPVLILTGDASVMSKITLLDAGANDYLTKPFSVGELKARLRALMRSRNQVITTTKQQLVAYGIALYRRTRLVSRNEQVVILRRKEFALLECLMENAGSVVSRGLLSRHAWPGENELWTNTVDVHIKHLRDKIDRPFEEPLIHTIHGLGYKLDKILKPAGQEVASQ